MNAVRDFFAAKRGALTTIPDDKSVVHITSIAEPYAVKQEGVTVMATRDNAAHMIALRSHRLSTPQEIAAHDEAEREATQSAENAREVPLSPATIAAVARAANESNRKKGAN
jgi:hypothetical protein